MKRAMIMVTIMSCVASFTLICHAASDPRFFGTYCGDYSERHGAHTYTFDIKANTEYKDTAHGNGLVTGRGDISGEGNHIPFVFSGVVTAHGKLRGSGIAGNMEPTIATASLSDDGNSVTLNAMDRTITLRKDRCDNNAPTASIRNPETGAFPWGDIITFSAVVSDREDTSFPEERVVWSSDRDGKLGNGLSLFKNNLSPGRHRIALSATDSGGRAATDSVVITVSNTSPNAPVIEEPSSGAVFYSGQSISFRVRATDREDGYLSGHSVVWSSDRSGRLGTGDLLRTRITDVGVHVITLTSTDRAGESNSTSVRITVRERPDGNTPPTVTIVSPNNYYAMGDNTCIILVAEASDLEDGVLRGTSLKWTEPSSSGIRNLGSGTRVEYCPPPSGADTRHIITVSATDSERLKSTNSITIIAIPGGLY